MIRVCIRAIPVSRIAPISRLPIFLKLVRRDIDSNAMTDGSIASALMAGNFPQLTAKAGMSQPIAASNPANTAPFQSSVK